MGIFVFYGGMAKMVYLFESKVLKTRCVLSVRVSSVVKRCGSLILAALIMPYSVATYATSCPDPQTTSLRWGVPPSPWVENPYSSNSPQGEENTRFVRANILIAGFGRGVVCTYKISVGEYSIWWQAPTKIPGPVDYNWIETLGGFVCTQGIEHCVFHVAP